MGYKVKMQHNLEDEEIYKFGTQGDEPVAEDVSQCRVTFEEAAHATQLNSGSTLSTLFGLVKKWLNDLVDRINGKQDTLTFDSTPTQHSTNPVESNGIYVGLNSKQDKLTAGENITIQNNVISSTGGGVSDYADLRHKPQINGVTLTGNKSTSDLHLDQVVEVTSAQYEAMEQAGTLDPSVAYFINDEDPDPVFPEDGSVGDVLTKGDNGVEWTDLGLGTAAQANVTDRLIPESTDVPESRAVYNAIASTISGIFTPKGNIDFADLTPALLIPANVGNVYETNDQGTTDSNWVQPAGTTIPAQSAVAIISADTIRFNYNGPAVFNLNDYQTKSLQATTQGANSVEGALTNLASQKAEQSALDTTNGNVSTLQTNSSKASLNNIFHLPYYRWGDIDPTHNTETFMKNLLDALEARSDIPKASSIFYWGAENPNSIVMVYGYTYDGSFKQYSGFHVIMYAEEYLCGYANGNWYFKTITTH